MGRKGWGSLNGNNISGGGGYGAPDGDRFDGFKESTTASRGYQTNHSSKVASPTSSGNGNGGGGGGWADWDDEDKGSSNVAASATS